MKKILFIILFSILGAVVLPLSVLAVTNISFSPASIDVEPGDDFTVTISIEPEEIIYTVRLELNFPAELLEIKSFTFARDFEWVQLSQDKHNLVDNENGLLIKTAGYPGGLASASEFGTISFSAKEAGKGIIDISNNSFALDSENQNILNEELAQLVLEITDPVSVPEITPPAEEIEEEIIEEETVVPEEMPEGEGEVVVFPGPEREGRTSFSAAVFTVLALGTGKVWVAVVIAIVVLAVLTYVVYCCSRRIHRKKLEKFEKPDSPEEPKKPEQFKI